MDSVLLDQDNDARKNAEARDELTKAMKSALSVGVQVTSAGKVIPFRRFSPAPQPPKTPTRQPVPDPMRRAAEIRKFDKLESATDKRALQRDLRRFVAETERPGDQLLAKLRWR